MKISKQAVWALERRFIRCVGNPDSRFQEDGLQILRALHFASAFDLEIEAETAAAMERNKGLLGGVAAERVREELTGLLLGSAAARVLREYAQVITVVLPELQPMIGCLQHNLYHCYDVWEHTLAVVEASPPEPVLRWAALLHDVGKPSCFSMDEAGVGHFYGHGEVSAALADGILRRLKLDDSSREEIAFLVKRHDLQLPLREASVERALRRFGAPRLKRLICLFEADARGQSRLAAPRLQTYQVLRRLVEEAAARQSALCRTDLAVNGHDLMALGFAGREIGTALELLLEAVVHRGLANEKTTLLAYLRQEAGT